MERIKYIEDIPTKIDNTHESVYRAYNILEVVKEMIKRWDSIKTIEWVINQCEKDLPPQWLG